MKTKALIRKVMIGAMMLALASAQQAQPKELGEGYMQVKGGGARVLPLKHTEVKAEISGFVADVRVTQVFVNDAKMPIEAVYVFPLPENSAVNEMTLVVGDRSIRGQIKKRAEAREVYERARAAGHTAALLDQERPNIFTQSVANIPAGKEVKVTLRYVQDLGYDDGVYKFNFPMTVGPRYISGSVTDASRITPPVSRPWRRSGRDISVTVRLNAGIAVKKLRSRSHDIELKELGGNSYEITLDEEDRIPNKDFLLTYEPAGKGIGSAVLAHKDGGEGYLTLMLQPAVDFPLSQVTPKELVFALDVSGSMSGFPMETARETAMRCLEGMNPGDTFQILSFASGNKLYFEKPLPNTPENVARGRNVLSGIEGGGGTEMLEALRTVLEFPKDPERMRIVLFMTDGYIGSESEILGFLREHLNGSRIFPLGVGSSTNRYLLDEMALLGKGTVEYVRQDERPARLEKVIERFYERISRPVMTDLEIDWNGLDVKEQEPVVVRDLFAGQPLFIHAKYGRGGAATLAVKGKMHGKPWAVPVRVKLPEKEKGNAAMGPLWARARIAGLTRKMYGNYETGEIEDEITALGLEHSLVTKYTSFVAVDESTAVDGKPLLVPVESELPEGTRYEGFFGGSGGGYAGSGSSPKGMLASVRGMFSSRGTAYSASAFTSREAPAIYIPPSARVKKAKPGEDKKAENKAGKVMPAKSEGMVAKLAMELLKNPSRRLARQLISLQNGKGAFIEPDGRMMRLEDQALAVVALVKARSLYGAGMDSTIGFALKWLRDHSGGYTDDLDLLRSTLKGGPYGGSSYVMVQLSALAGEVEKLK